MFEIPSIRLLVEVISEARTGHFPWHHLPTFLDLMNARLS